MSADQKRSAPGYIGHSYPNVEHRIGEDGEVLVRSPGNMKGYFKMPEENKHVFTEDGFLHTGDLGSIDETGRLKITGRAKELFKTSKGEYVAPAPIENLLSNHPLLDMTYGTLTEKWYEMEQPVVWQAAG